MNLQADHCWRLSIPHDDAPLNSHAHRIGEPTREHEGKECVSLCLEREWFYSNIDLSRCLALVSYLYEANHLVLSLPLQHFLNEKEVE
ncbi:MAG TPA: hypothetical protein DDW49_07020 [Deltaproteobacteria bacterium]|nr:MAG: hypothetical protein A2048_10155 [Deltaproteobacteria bacterium GWA2_45_12]HBF13122.1 hypothetical protein [Deltaproteobacteria bacterium]